MKLRELIKVKRMELKLSQQELALMVGYKSRSTISKIESGVNDIPRSKVKLFAEVLQIPCTELVEESPVEQQEESTLQDTIDTFNDSDEDMVDRVIELLIDKCDTYADAITHIGLLSERARRRNQTHLLPMFRGIQDFFKEEKDLVH